MSNLAQGQSDHRPTFRLRHLASIRSSVVLPLLLFGAVFAAYLGAIAVILATPTAIAAIGVPICGFLVVMLFVIGHDACHQSFTSSPGLNRIIGRIAFLPALHSYSLWDCEHNRRHHRFNNINGLDYAWIPLSPDEFGRLGLLSRLKYRFYRDPGGVFFYYLLEIWAQRKIFPRRKMVGTVRAVQIADTILLVGFVVLAVAALVAAGSWVGKGPWESVTLALVAPFLVFNALISAAIFLHHTHPAVPWYATYEDWKQDRGAIRGTVHVEFPRLIRLIVLNIMEHNVHHQSPGVPLYLLSSMQTPANSAKSVAWKFSIADYFDICASCKLFDYQTFRWLDFKCQPTARTISTRPALRSRVEPILPTS